MKKTIFFLLFSVIFIRAYASNNIGVPTRFEYFNLHDLCIELSNLEQQENEPDRCTYCAACGQIIFCISCECSDACADAAATFLELSLCLASPNCCYTVSPPPGN
jgi:hypothetical protein